MLERSRNRKRSVSMTFGIASASMPWRAKISTKYCEGVTTRSAMRRVRPSSGHRPSCRSARPSRKLRMDFRPNSLASRQRRRMQEKRRRPGAEAVDNVIAPHRGNGFGDKVQHGDRRAHELDALQEAQRAWQYGIDWQMLDLDAQLGGVSFEAAAEAIRLHALAADDVERGSDQQDAHAHGMEAGSRAAAR